MFSSAAAPRVPVRTATLVAAVVVLLAAGLLVGLSPSRAEVQAAGAQQAGVLQAGAVKASALQASASKASASKVGPNRRKPRFTVASINLRKGMSVRAMRQDIRTVLRRSRTSIIGFQERLNSRPALRRALPRNWGLLMPQRSATGTDDNPIAFKRSVWKLKMRWSKLLTANTWRRNSGRIAHDQYGVVAILRHRRTGLMVRAISFHLPPGIHNRHTGGPDWSNRDRVRAMWRMARSVRQLKHRTPPRHQFLILCDCNVNHRKDTTNKLLKGKITRPLRLATNYDVGGYRPGWRIDYVMGERLNRFKMVGWRSFRDLNTDHPAVLAGFRKR